MSTDGVEKHSTEVDDLEIHNSVSISEFDQFGRQLTTATDSVTYAPDGLGGLAVFEAGTHVVSQVVTFNRDGQVSTSRTTTSRHQVNGDGTLGAAVSDEAIREVVRTATTYDSKGRLMGSTEQLSSNADDTVTIQHLSVDDLDAQGRQKDITVDSVTYTDSLLGTKLEHGTRTITTDITYDQFNRQDRRGRGHAFFILRVGPCRGAQWTGNG